MKSFLAIILSACLFLFLVFSSVLPAGAEKSTVGRSPKVISTKDKADINEIFRSSVGLRNYRMEFGNGETFGAFELNSTIAYKLRKGYQLDLDDFSGQLYKTYQPKLAFWYFVNKSGTEGVEAVLGKANAARLQAVINKYTVTDK
jgi:hypothetical protein